MLLSAEIRWFWKDHAPPGLKMWFVDPELHGCPAGGGSTGRTDIYLKGDGKGELGIKVRGRIGASNEDAFTMASDCIAEVKGLVALDPATITCGPFEGGIEIWCKWSLTGLDLTQNDRMIVHKRRWLRKFDTTSDQPREMVLGIDERPVDERDLKQPPARGCQVEYTEVTSYGISEEWYSLSFESFGSIDTITGDLSSIADVMAKRGCIPSLQGGEHLNYPQWLAKYVRPIK